MPRGAVIFYGPPASPMAVESEDCKVKCEAALFREASCLNVGGRSISTSPSAQSARGGRAKRASAHVKHHGVIAGGCRRRKWPPGPGARWRRKRRSCMALLAISSASHHRRRNVISRSAIMNQDMTGSDGIWRDSVAGNRSAKA